MSEHWRSSFGLSTSNRTHGGTLFQSFPDNFIGQSRLLRMSRKHLCKEWLVEAYEHLGRQRSYGKRLRTIVLQQLESFFLGALVTGNGYYGHDTLRKYGEYHIENGHAQVGTGCEIDARQITRPVPVLIYFVEWPGLKIGKLCWWGYWNLLVDQITSSHAIWYFHQGEYALIHEQLHHGTEHDLFNAAQFSVQLFYSRQNEKVSWRK